MYLLQMRCIHAYDVTFTGERAIEVENKSLESDHNY